MTLTSGCMVGPRTGDGGDRGKERFGELCA